MLQIQQSVREPDVPYTTTLSSALTLSIYVNSRFNDTYTRNIYHNTINLPGSHAVFVQSGQVDIKNNIGPSDAGNMETDNSFFVSTQTGSEDFHLVAGSLPIDSGTDCGITVDFDGNPRPYGAAPDMGAYEYGVVGIKHNVPQNNNPLNTIQLYPRKAVSLLPIVLVIHVATPGLAFMIYQENY